MTSLPALGSVVAGKYRIEALLGQGGMGAVFRAHHELMDKPVALKWLHPRLWDNQEAKERFVREARAVARIRHPNVVEVFDVCVQDDALYIVMELLEGHSLEALLQAGELSVPEALACVTGALRGVAAAHARGIIHRDIKPENIFVSNAGEGFAARAKILDFGISKLIDDADGAAHVTKTGSTMGTPAYMSFEHMNGAKDVDERTDVYSFGVVLYRILTGVVPFAGETFAAVAVQMATQRPTAPKQLRPELPSYLNGVVMKAMAFDRRDRYPSAAALIDALEVLTSDAGYLARITHPGAEAEDVARLPAADFDGAFLHSTRKLEPVPASSEPMKTAPPARPRRRPLVGAVVVGCIVTAGMLAALARSGPRVPPPPTAAPEAGPLAPARVLRTQPNAPVPTSASGDNEDWRVEVQEAPEPSPSAYPAPADPAHAEDAGAARILAPVPHVERGAPPRPESIRAAPSRPRARKVQPRSAPIGTDQF